jgi:hypothetical protein
MFLGYGMFYSRSHYAYFSSSEVNGTLFGNKDDEKLDFSLNK